MPVQTRTYGGTSLFEVWRGGGGGGGSRVTDTFLYVQTIRYLSSMFAGILG